MPRASTALWKEGMKANTAENQTDPSVSPSSAVSKSAVVIKFYSSALLLLLKLCPSACTDMSKKAKARLRDPASCTPLGGNSIGFLTA